jgi:hypothetical protein
MRTEKSYQFLKLPFDYNLFLTSVEPLMLLQGDTVNRKEKRKMNTQKKEVITIFLETLRESVA